MFKRDLLQIGHDIKMLEELGKSLKEELEHIETEMTTKKLQITNVEYLSKEWSKELVADIKPDYQKIQRDRQSHLQDQADFRRESDRDDEIINQREGEEQ